MKSCIMKDIAKRLENKKKSSLLIVLCVFCFKCNAQNNNMLYINDSIESHILRGDSNAYNILSEKVYGINLLPYALIMASSYNYGLACYDIYTIIIEEMHDKNNLSIDSLLLEAAINYLIKGADLSNWNCCIELSYLYEKGLFVEQSDQKSLMYLERAKRVKVKYIIEHDESGEKE